VIIKVTKMQRLKNRGGRQAGGAERRIRRPTGAAFIVIIFVIIRAAKRQKIAQDSRSGGISSVFSSRL